MRRFNKTAHAPVGTAFFLVLGLAILPFSLKAAGVRVALSPRISAALDAWQQIAEVFGASYQPGIIPDLSLVTEESVPATAEDSIDQTGQVACAREFAEETSGLGPVSETKVSCSLAVRRTTSKALPRLCIPARQPVSIVVASSATKSQAVELLSGLRLEMDTHLEMLKGIEKQIFRPSFAPVAKFRTLPLTKELRVLVRAKRAAASSEKTECKVYSAMSSERKRDLERAALIGTPNLSPDYSEF